MGLVIAAGASTGLGAAVVFIPSIVKLASRRVLAGSLGFSAGVMSYVSFIEIFPKSLVAFEEAGHSPEMAYLFSTSSFFGGVLLMMVLNILVSKLLGGHGHRHEAKGTPKDDKKGSKHKKTTRDDVSMDDVDALPCCNKDPVGQLDQFHKMASVIQHEENASVNSEMDMEVDIEDDFVDNLPLDDRDSDSEDEEKEGDKDDKHEKDQKTSEENKKLVRMGVNTALAIGLHNFPEGLATFVATLNDPKVGSVLAFAIAIHNIPEGLCVALPIFYATGNRLKAFLWALLSGFSEVVAALLGWAVLASVVSNNTYGALFGLVSGMMVIISIRELIPTAHFYDPEDTCVTFSFIGGMVLMALSLVLFFL